MKLSQVKLSQENRMELVCGAASAASLFGLLVGVPLLLMIGIGWPLPQQMPSGSEALTAIKTGDIPPSLILKPIAVVVWILWLQMLAGVGIELWAHCQGRVAPRVAFIPAFMQRWSARLIATVLVIAFSMQNPVSALADNKDLLAPTTLAVGEINPAGRGAETTGTGAIHTGTHHAGATGAAGESPSLVHPVDQTSSLRSLAEQYLGDSNRWAEVFVVSPGEQTGDTAASVPTTPTGDTVYQAPAAPAAETVYLAPTTPTGDPAALAPAAGPPAPYDWERHVVTVQEGDTLWGLAGQHLNDPERWVEIYDANRDVIQDPDLIRPGWQLRIPLDGVPAGAGEPERVAPVAAFTAFHPTVVAAVAPPSSDRQSAGYDQLELAEPTPRPDQPAPEPAPASSSSTQTVLAVGGLGVFASSLGWMLARLRKAQRRRLPTGRTPGLATPEAAAMDQQIQTAADPDAALFLDAALRVMSSRLAGSQIASSGPPEIVGVTLGPDGVSIHLGSPHEPPPGFQPTQNNMAWTLFREAEFNDLLAEADYVPAPLPALVAAGTSGSSEYLLNLEHMAALGLDGDEAAIAEWCAAVAIQLASSHLADDLVVVCVGFGQDLTVFDRVEHVPDVASALDRIEHHERQRRALFGRHSSLTDSRIGGLGGIGEPLVILAPHRLDPADAALLLRAGGPSACVVGHGLEGATWWGHFDEANPAGASPAGASPAGRGLLLQPIGIRLEPHGLTGAAASSVAELVSEAKQAKLPDRAVPLVQQATSVQVRVPELAGPEPGQDPAPQQIPDAVNINDGNVDAVGSNAVGPDAVNTDAGSHPVTGKVEVRVLGTVDVVGAAHPFASRRALDMVAFLALHPKGADRDQLKAQIWPPDNPPSDSTLANTVSRARKALGENDRGELYLPRVNSDGIYRLRPEVATDVGRFEALVASGRGDPGEAGRKHLQAALDSVRGIPFTGGTGDMYRWADFGLRTQIEFLVDTTAHELAQRCMDAGDPQGAASAAMVSLRAVGVCEQCYSFRLEAAAGSPAELRKIMDELVKVLRRENEQSDVEDLLGPELLELYEELVSPMR